MQVPEHARKARRSNPKRGKLRTRDLPFATRLREELGFAGELATDKDFIRTFESALKNHTQSFFAREGISGANLTHWMQPDHQNVFREMAKTLRSLLTQLLFRLNQNQRNMHKYKGRASSSSQPAETSRQSYTAADNAQRQTTQQQGNAPRTSAIINNNNGSSSSNTTTAMAGSDTVNSYIHEGYSLETAIDVDGLPAFEFDPLDFEDGPRHAKYLNDPDLPPSNLHYIPRAPQPTVEDQVDEYYLQPSNNVPSEQADSAPAQDPYAGPDSREAAAPGSNGQAKRPAEDEPEQDRRRTKTPRQEQDEEPMDARAGANENNHGVSSVPSEHCSDLYGYLSGRPRKQTQRENCILGEDAMDRVLGPMSRERSKDLETDSRVASTTEDLGSNVPPQPGTAVDPVPETDPEAIQKQPEASPAEASPEKRDPLPVDKACVSQDSIQPQPQPQPQPQQGVDPGHQQGPEMSPEQEPQNDDSAINSPQQRHTENNPPAKQPTRAPPLNFAFTVYLTEMDPIFWRFSREFFQMSMQELVDELPLEGKNSLDRLSITVRATKWVDSHQIFMFNEEYYKSVREGYVRRISQDMRNAKQDGSRLDYEIIIKPGRPEDRNDGPFVLQI
ncbi:hypothetical protein FALBO_3113 [Fusarium albosuccineum]|uniref:Uncharacterized protein n=1 Tax=Fusarium albosuccineum TaxID=1237068 RepID=A0A8H4LKD9_9HYPO|nr:hypothetical protein FALBO_3113 [Fusarium albosuccineum]